LGVTRYLFGCTYSPPILDLTEWDIDSDHRAGTEWISN
jgi:hypothetical protein